MTEILALPAFDDNYIWLLRANGQVAVVDPGDAAPVLQHLAQSGDRLCAILATHHHGDHIGGVAELAARWPVPVFGPALEEVLKSCLAAWVVDRRARVFVARDQILLAGAWSGVCFAAVEAMMYTHRSLEAPSAELVWYRWTVCVVLHAACSLMAAIGLADSWESSRRGEKGGALAAAPFLLAAIVLHAGYNAMCVVLSIRGYAM